MLSHSETIPIPFIVRRSVRARRIRLVIKHDVGLVVVLPLLASLRVAENFLHQKRSWIMRSLDKIKNQEFQPIVKGTKREFVRRRTEAYELAVQKLKKFNEVYKFTFNKVTIRNQKTRWGSCTKTGNLSFNYKIVFLPDHLADYLVVHELCHLGELNHSRNYWNLVARTIPDYRKVQRELRKTKV